MGIALFFLMDLLQVPSLRHISKSQKDWIIQHGVTLLPFSSTAINGRGKKDTFVFAINGLFYNGLQVYANMNTNGNLASIWVHGFEETPERLLDPWKRFQSLLFEECQLAGYLQDAYT